ncbi:hypothetical protein MMPV_001527 [Pyropia vietnamensis]
MADSPPIRGASPAEVGMEEEDYLPLSPIEAERYGWDGCPRGDNLSYARFQAVGVMTMVSIWRTIRFQYGAVYALWPDLPSDLPFYRGEGDVRLLRDVERILKEPPPEVTDGVCTDLRFHPGPLPLMGEDDVGYYTRNSLSEWRIREAVNLMVAAELREYHQVPPRARAGLYPAVPSWWPSVEVPRGMPCRLPPFVVLRGSLLLASPRGAHVNAMLATSWLAEVADVFLSSVLKHGHLWLLSEALVTHLGALDSATLFKEGDCEELNLFEEALCLLGRIRDRVPAERLLDQGGRRGLVLVDKAVCQVTGRLVAVGGGQQHVEPPYLSTPTPR